MSILLPCAFTLDKQPPKKLQPWILAWQTRWQLAHSKALET
ncbi:MAG: hypothetical protein RIM23_11730 [Coleofasciculus sp. G3-WIS-01]